MEPAGPLLGKGREADVYEHGPGLVLRRYRTGHNAEQEAEVMQHVWKQGYPVPEVVDASGADLVMERIDGPTMLAALARRPLPAAVSLAGVLADLHRRLHGLQPPPGVPAGFGTGDALLHLDLHPENVIMSASGPVVIDWKNACRGDAAADVAMTWIVMATSEVPGSMARRLLATVGRRSFVWLWLRRFDRAAASRWLPAVANKRLATRHLTPRERVLVERMALRGR